MRTWFFYKTYIYLSLNLYVYIYMNLCAPEEGVWSTTLEVTVSSKNQIQATCKSSKYS